MRRHRDPPPRLFIDASVGKLGTGREPSSPNDDELERLGSTSLRPRRSRIPGEDFPDADLSFSPPYPALQGNTKSKKLRERAERSEAGDQSFFVSASEPAGVHEAPASGHKASPIGLPLVGGQILRGFLIRCSVDAYHGVVGGGQSFGVAILRRRVQLELVGIPSAFAACPPRLDCRYRSPAPKPPECCGSPFRPGSELAASLVDKLGSVKAQWTSIFFVPGLGWCSTPL